MTTDSWSQFVYAYDWWIDNMRTRPRPLQEKMTLFWHGHFTSSWFDGIGRTDHMMHQNQLYRDMAVGNFRTLTQAMSLEPAMLVYLNNADNRKGSPNQNFARELMELFTLGVGNYTEGDVEAAARAWTGHNADWPEYTYQFFTNRHDNEQDVLRHHQELGRPRHHQRDPARQRRQALDRGPLHHQEAVGLLRLPGGPSHGDQRAGRRASSPTTWRSSR